MTIAILLLAAVQRLKQRLGNWLFWPLAIIAVVLLVHLAIAALTVLIPVVVIIGLFRWFRRSQRPTTSHRRDKTIIDGNFRDLNN